MVSRGLCKGPRHQHLHGASNRKHAETKQVGHASLTEIGAGNGGYSQFWKRKGLNVNCYDGNLVVKQLSLGLCSTLDLSVRQPGVQVSDFVVSLEVAEHIPRNREANFISNVHMANRKGVVITWAQPGQPGNGHVNARTEEYVRELFTSMGYQLDQYYTKLLRTAATCNGTDRGQPNAPWFERGALVFDKRHVSSGAAGVQALDKQHVASGPAGVQAENAASGGGTHPDGATSVSAASVVSVMVVLISVLTIGVLTVGFLVGLCTSRYFGMRLPLESNYQPTDMIGKPEMSE